MRCQRVFRPPCELVFVYRARSVLLKRRVREAVARSVCSAERCAGSDSRPPAATTARSSEADRHDCDIPTDHGLTELGEPRGVRGRRRRSSRSSSTDRPTTVASSSNGCTARHQAAPMRDVRTGRGVATAADVADPGSHQRASPPTTGSENLRIVCPTVQRRSRRIAGASTAERQPGLLMARLSREYRHRFARQACDGRPAAVVPRVTAGRRKRPPVRQLSLTRQTAALLARRQEVRGLGQRGAQVDPAFATRDGAEIDRAR